MTTGQILKALCCCVLQFFLSCSAYCVRVKKGVPLLSGSHKEHKCIIYRHLASDFMTNACASGTLSQLGYSWYSLDFDVVETGLIIGQRYAKCGRVALEKVGLFLANKTICRASSIT